MCAHMICDSFPQAEVAKRQLTRQERAVAAGLLTLMRTAIPSSMMVQENGTDSANAGPAARMSAAVNRRLRRRDDMRTPRTPAAGHKDLGQQQLGTGDFLGKIKGVTVAAPSPVLYTPAATRKRARDGHVAEWLRSGLQNRLLR